MAMAIMLGKTNAINTTHAESSYEESARKEELVPENSSTVRKKQRSFDASNKPRLGKVIDVQPDHAAEELITGDSDDPPLSEEEVEEMTTMTNNPIITEHEAAQVKSANASSATPVLFVHGLWLLPSSWDRWVTLFEQDGFVALTPGWPDDPETVTEAREHPEVFAGKGIGEIADHHEAIIRRLDRRPVIIGHSFGGLLTMILAGRGLAAASVAISPAPFRGVLPLPISALRSASVALRNPANWNRAVPLSYEQFRYSFANAVGEDEAKELYLGYSVPGAGEPLFQAASANFNPWSEAKVNSMNPERGPMLIVSADSDHTVPWAIANASYKKQKRNKGVTEIVKMPGRGHALTIDAGWREVAEKSLEFVKRFTGTLSPSVAA
jgi:non-heme chloroperoxidase